MSLYFHPTFREPICLFGRVTECVEQSHDNRWRVAASLSETLGNSAERLGEAGASDAPATAITETPVRFGGAGKMIPIITAVAGVLSALSSISNLSGTPSPSVSDASQSTASGVASANFADALQSALNRADNAISTANQKAKAFASGDKTVSLSDVMVSLEQANLALQAASAVRDKVVAAYSNVMNMPV